MPLAEHDVSPNVFAQAVSVSIHVPLAEHDVKNPGQDGPGLLFQFTCPSRSTTWSSGGRK